MIGTVRYTEPEIEEEQEERGKKIKWVSLFTILDVYTKWVTKQNDLFVLLLTPLFLVTSTNKSNFEFSTHLKSTRLPT